MTTITPSTDSTELPSFEKHGKVSVWCSNVSYDTIADSYFEEDDQGLDAWARNFSIHHYDHENMETNGVASGTALVKSIIQDCSYSSAYGDSVIHKINKMGHQQVSWIILLFDFEYRNKLTKIHEDDMVQYVGSFVYDMDSTSMAEQEQIEAAREEKRLLEVQRVLDEQAALTDAESASAPAQVLEPSIETAPKPVTEARKPQPVAEPAVKRVEPKGHNPWLK